MEGTPFSAPRLVPGAANDACSGESAPRPLAGPRPLRYAASEERCGPLALRYLGRPARLSPVAQELRRIIGENPGIHFRQLGRLAGITSAGQLRHHADRLVRAQEVVEVKDGRFSRYFVRGSHDAALRGCLARFARPVPRTIAKLLLQEPLSRTELRRRLNCADSTLGYHLARLLKDGDLVRQVGRHGGLYALANPEAARQTLLQLQNGAIEPKPGQPAPAATAPEPAPLATATPILAF